ncbi:MAG TPA: hypothetical protein VFI25_14675 [Planctomycetota bacterium]|nr:hypothetical protein [Planctomycetota bacterium]
MRPGLARPFGKIEVELQGRVRFELPGRTLSGTVTRTGPDGTLDLEEIRLEISDPADPGRGAGKIQAVRGRVRLAEGTGGSALEPNTPLHLEEASGTYAEAALPEEPVRFRAEFADLDPRAQRFRASGAASVERGALSLEGEGLDADLADSSFSLERKIRFTQAGPAGRRLVATADGPGRAEIEPPDAAGWRRATFVLENAVRVSSESSREPATGAGNRLAAVAEVPPRGAARGSREPGRIRELVLSGDATLRGAFGAASSPRIETWLDEQGRIARVFAQEGATLFLAEGKGSAGGEDSVRLQIGAIESRGALYAERAGEGGERFDVHFAGPTLLHAVDSVLPTYIAGPSSARIEAGRLLRLLATGGAWLRFGGANSYAPVAEIVPDVQGLTLLLGPSAFLDARSAAAVRETVGGGTLSSGGWASLRLPSGAEGAGSATLPEGASLSFEGGGSLDAERIEFAGNPQGSDARVLAEGGYRFHDPTRGITATGDSLSMEGQERFRTSGKPARVEMRAGTAALKLSARGIEGDRSSLRAEEEVEVTLPAEWLSPLGHGEGPGEDAPAVPAIARCARLTAQRDPASGEVRSATLEGEVRVESASLRASAARFEIDRAEGRHRLLGEGADARLALRAPEGEFEGAAPEIVLEGDGAVVLLSPRGQLRFRPAPKRASGDKERAPLVPVDLAFEGTLRFETATKALRVAGRFRAESAGETPWTLEAKELESTIEEGGGSFLAREDARLVVRDVLEARGDELRFDPKTGDVGALGKPARIDLPGGPWSAKRLHFNLRTGLIEFEEGAFSDRPRR